MRLIETVYILQGRLAVVENLPYTSSALEPAPPSGAGALYAAVHALSAAVAQLEPNTNAESLKQMGCVAH